MPLALNPWPYTKSPVMGSVNAAEGDGMASPFPSGMTASCWISESVTYTAPLVTTTSFRKPDWNEIRLEQAPLEAS